MEIWLNTDALDRCEVVRENKRKYYGRLAFDCYRCKAKGDKAVCEAGHPIGTAKDGSSPLVSVLMGWTSSDCKVCPDYNGE